jgi:SAM-dependent methyltransferase
MLQTESYSAIISSEDYNCLMNDQHLYISQCDQYLVDMICEMSKDRTLEVVELGCGPLRFTRKLASIANINLTAIDVDEVFYSYGIKSSKEENLKINMVNDNIANYNHHKPVDIFCSNGLHHHVFKGVNCNKYLVNVANQLSDDGYYYLMDEFIPEYKDDKERNLKIIIWYSHIIADAINNKYYHLAQEEAKTLLDDLEEGSDEPHQLKNIKKIELVLSYVSLINEYAMNKQDEKAREIATEMLEKLKQNNEFQPLDDHNSIKLSRKDYKICDRVLKQELSEAGLMVVGMISFGPIENIGGLCVYKIKKI